MTDHLTVKLQFKDDEEEFLLPLQLGDFIISYEGINSLETRIMSFVETTITKHDLIKDYLEELEDNDTISTMKLHFSLFKEGHIFTHEDALSLDGTVTIQDVRSKVLNFFTVFNSQPVAIKEFYVNFYMSKDNREYKKITKDIFLGTSNTENEDKLIVGVTNVYTNMNNSCLQSHNYIVELLCLDSITQNILKYKFIPASSNSLNLEEVRKFFQ